MPAFTSHGNFILFFSTHIHKSTDCWKSITSRIKVCWSKTKLLFSDDDGKHKLRPWEENNGYYGILARLVKNHSPTFIFTVKCGAVDYNYLSKDQMINHFNKNGCFTTKVHLLGHLLRFHSYAWRNFPSRLVSALTHVMCHGSRRLMPMNFFQGASNWARKKTAWHS